jgi:hypothetical protein
MNRVCAPGLGDFPQHREERREAGAARQEQQWAFDVAQIEAACRANELDRRARHGVFA